VRQRRVVVGFNVTGIARAANAIFATLVCVARMVKLRRRVRLCFRLWSTAERASAGAGFGYLGYLFLLNS